MWVACFVGVVLAVSNWSKWYLKGKRNETATFQRFLRAGYTFTQILGPQRKPNPASDMLLPHGGGPVRRCLFLQRASESGFAHSGRDELAGRGPRPRSAVAMQQGLQGEEHYS